MNTLLKILSIISILGLLSLVIHLSNTNDEYLETNNVLNEELLSIERKINETNSLLESDWKINTKRSKNTESIIYDNIENEAKFQLSSNSKLKVSSHEASSNCHVSAYQGVEVHFDSLIWMNQKFSKNEGGDIIAPFYGSNKFDCNRLVFDPDLPDRGYPDIVGTVTEPTPFNLNKFLRKPLGSYQISKPLNFALSSAKPVDTQTWKTRISDKPTKVRMETWLLEFDLAVSVRPADSKNKRIIVDGNLKNPVTSEKVKHMGDERDNYRYGALDIVLKFLPKTSSWYIENDADNDSLFKEGDLHIGIAAVEVIYLDKSENKLREGTGEADVYLDKGGSLSLSLTPEELPARKKLGLRNKGEVLSRPEVIEIDNKKLETDNGQLNPELFDVPKYAVITFPNFGTWHKKGGLFKKEQVFADQIEAKLLIHTFVVGRWELKREKYVDFEAPKSIQYEKPSAVSRIGDSVAGFFSSFLPGFSFKFLSYIFWPIIISVLIFIFFPQLFGLILSGVIRSIKSVVIAIRDNGNQGS